MNLYDIIETSEERVSEITSDLDTQYLSYPIKKRSGKKRWLDAPTEELKLIQQYILWNILYKFSVHKAAMGFVVGRGVSDSANKHLGNKALLCMDISNFFNSIKAGRLYKTAFFLFNRYKNFEESFVFTKKDIEHFVKLITYRGQLPQGAPTSPAVANIVTINLDKKLEDYSSTRGLVYTRYADDVSFSTKDPQYKIGKHIKDITEIIESESFSVNKKKTRIRKPNQRMSVTGIVINDKLGIPKWKRQNFRAQLHNLIKNETEISLEEYQKLRGYCEWIRTLNPPKGEHFLTQLGKVMRQS